MDNHQNAGRPTALPAFQEWLSSCRPYGASYFYYDTADAYRHLHLLFVPHSNKEGVIHVRADMNYLDMLCTMTVAINERRKRVSVTGVTCDTHIVWPEYYSLPLELPRMVHGGVKHYKHSVAFLEGEWDIERCIADKFFGPEWKLTCSKTNGGHENGTSKKGKKNTKVRMVPYELHESGLDKIDHHMTRYPGPWKPMGEVVCFYDLDRYNRAATRLQATWKGWLARRDYRYNPYTTLGRHLVLRDFEDLLVCSP
jgi:IQ calmodulin-binding motif